MNIGDINVYSLLVIDIIEPELLNYAQILNDLI